MFGTCYHRSCLRLPTPQPISTCLSFWWKKYDRKQECLLSQWLSLRAASSFSQANRLHSIAHFGKSTQGRQKPCSSASSLNYPLVLSKSFIYHHNNKMTSTSVRNSSAFLAQKALPNILVHFVDVYNATEQQSILKHMAKSIDSLYGVDRFVVYKVQDDELIGDSRTYSASALLVVHDRNEPSPNLSKSKIPHLVLSLEQLCPKGIEHFDGDYFAEQIQKCIATDKPLTVAESSIYDDTPVYLFDSKRTFDTWLKMHLHDKQTNLVEYQSNLPQANLDPNDVSFIYWHQSGGQVKLEGFNAKRYFNNLETNYLGRTLVFADKVSTTMDLVTRFKQVNGIVATANYQTAGIGRNANKWLSPKGCAMFTISLQLASSSTMMARLPLIQHLASLSVILALPSTELNVKIKWPNDILFGESMSKLAGILTRSYCHGNQINVQIGMGINLSNRQPSVCLDDVIELYNSRLPESGTKVELILKETLIAKILNNLERLIDMLAEGKTRLPEIKQMYLDRWIHSDAIIDVHDNTDPEMHKQARICGINDDGYLLAEDVLSGELITLKPDGNRFDLMRNLVILNG